MPVYEPQPMREIVLRPNRSLSVSGFFGLFLAIMLWLTVIAIPFALLGAWLVTPFLLLEIGVVGGAFGYLWRHADDHETLLLDEDHLTVIQRHGRRRSEERFQRYWLRVALEEDGRRGWAPRLLLSSHGRSVEIGAMLAAGERRLLAERLHALLHTGS